MTVGAAVAQSSVIVPVIEETGREHLPPDQQTYLQTLLYNLEGIVHEIYFTKVQNCWGISVVNSS